MRINFFLIMSLTPFLFGQGLVSFGNEARVSSEALRTQARKRMVQKQMVERGIENKKVLEAIKRVKRHLFVPEEYQEAAYEDRPLPIGHGQTISQPYIVAFMTNALEVKETDRVLEIGTGSGYQAAVLAKLVKEVYTVEIVKDLAEHSRKTLRSLGYQNVHVKHSDGYKGWPEKAPFDKIILTAAPSTLPAPLLQQLKTPGILLAPVGELKQEIRKIKKSKEGLQEQTLLRVRFVPMTGKAQDD